jgi:signal transduction histidine kinase
MFKPGKMLSGVQWRWVLIVGAGVAALTFALMYLTINFYAAVLSILSRGDVDRAALDRFADIMAAWGLPALYLLLVAGAAAWLVRSAGVATTRQGVLAGLVSAAGLQIIGLAFGPPLLRELILYPLLGVAGGWLGSVIGGVALAGRETLYRASRDVGAATSAQEIAAAIGENLTDAEVEQLTLWSILSHAAGADGPLELELLASWAPRAAGIWPPERRLDAAQLPALSDLRRQSPRVVRRRELPPPEREVWRRQSIRSALLVPLAAPGDGPDGLLVVASPKRWSFSWGRVRAYQTVGAQAALALENLHLVEEARRSGELGERERLAHEIHDTLIQGFASIAMNLEAAKGSLERNPASARRHMDEARRTARENLVEARRIVRALQPGALEQTPLPEALARLAEKWSEESSATASVTITGAARPLSPEAEVTLLRAAQEALTNVRKHARASRAVLTLSYMEDRVALDVRDDGVGFDPEGAYAVLDAEGASGFGLKAMRERAERSGGALLVESEPGRGTTLAVELPVPADGWAKRGAGVREDAP